MTKKKNRQINVRIANRPFRSLTCFFGPNRWFDPSIRHKASDFRKYFCYAFSLTYISDLNVTYNIYNIAQYFLKRFTKALSKDYLFRCKELSDIFRFLKWKIFLTVNINLNEMPGIVLYLFIISKVIKPIVYKEKVKAIRLSNNC